MTDGRVRTRLWPPRTVHLAAVTVLIIVASLVAWSPPGDDLRISIDDTLDAASAALYEPGPAPEVTSSPLPRGPGLPTSSATSARTAAPPVATPETSEPVTETGTDRGSTAGGLGAAPSGAVNVAFAPGQSVWSGRSNGFDIRVSADPSPARAGGRTTFTVQVSRPDSSDCCGTSMVFGDGGVTDHLPGGCEVTGRSTTTRAFPYTYNRSGRWQFQVDVSTTGCGGNTAYGQLRGTIEVLAGSSAGQGPAIPVVRVDSSTRPSGHEQDFSYVTLWGHAADPDGYITKLVVDWGDGSKKVTFPGDEMPCQPTPRGWPAASEASVPHRPPPQHRYAAAGTYRITLTAYSASCDGSDVQTGRASFDWSWAPPSP